MKTWVSTGIKCFWESACCIKVSVIKRLYTAYALVELEPWSWHDYVQQLVSANPASMAAIPYISFDV